MHRTGHAPFRLPVYTPLLKLQNPLRQFPVTTQVNAIKQLLQYQETLSCFGVHYYVMREAYDAGCHTEK